MVRIKSVSILELQNSAWLTVSVSKCLLSLIEVMETPLGKRTRARTCVPSGDSSAQFLVSDSCRAESSPTFTTVHPLALRLQNQSCRFMGAPPASLQEATSKLSSWQSVPRLSAPSTSKPWRELCQAAIEVRDSIQAWERGWQSKPQSSRSPVDFVWPGPRGTPKALAPEQE